MCYACACVLGADTHACAHLCSAAVEASCDPATQSKTRLLNRPNICLGCLSQSPWLLKLVPLSACCWFVCFLVRLCERKCGFPVRAGSWIKSAQTQRLADNCCWSPANSLKAARVYVGTPQWGAKGGNCFVCLWCWRRRKECDFSWAGGL